MARVARKAPQIESRSLARISQGPHWREIAAVRSLRSRSALLRLDRQPGEATRRRSLCDQGDAAQTCQQMVGHQSPALDGTEQRRVAQAGRLGCGSHSEQVRGEAQDSRAAGYIAKAIKADPKAWSFFQKLPRTERRNFVVWIYIAKRPETRARRIRESIALLAAGKKLGLK